MKMSAMNFFFPPFDDFEGLSPKEMEEKLRACGLCIPKDQYEEVLLLSGFEYGMGRSRYLVGKQFVIELLECKQLVVHKMPDEAAIAALRDGNTVFMRFWNPFGPAYYKEGRKPRYFLYDVEMDSRQLAQLRIKKIIQ
jgi:hypothetical protein